MIYEVKVRVVQEDTVLVKAETQDEAKKLATSDRVISRTNLADTIEYYADEIRNVYGPVNNDNTEAHCKTVGGEMGYSKCYKNGKEIKYE